MALYLISYDITEKNDDYQSLWDRLAAMKAVKVLYSEWLFPDATGRAEAITTDLKAHIEQGDSLFVQEVGRDADWVGLKIPDDAVDVLLRHCRF